MSGRIAKTQQGQRITAIKAESHSGPLPHPDTFARYDEILPGAAERILAMAERQSAHRQKLESFVLHSDARHAVLGTLCALAIGVAGMATAAYCTVNGHDWVGGVIGGTTICTLVGTFVYGTAQRKKERNAPPAQ